MESNVKRKQSNGVILWQGESLIDGAPIVVIATGLAGKSSNAKTGNMVQTWIMRSDIAPHIAVKTGQDASVCGDCNLRPIHAKARGKKRPCYVKTFQAPRSVFDGFKRGIYPHAYYPATARKLFADRVVRLGSYGNPSAAPLDIWQNAVADAAGHTGYVHNWRTCDRSWSRLVMASVESLSEAIEARKLGYRLFRVRDADDVQKGEVKCPASKEAGFKTTCYQCKACGGTSAKAKADITILAH
jgi:hypothetical protein